MQKKPLVQWLPTLDAMNIVVACNQPESHQANRIALKSANKKRPTKKGSTKFVLPFESGAGEESRTLDLNLGKVALYQLSYSRIAKAGF